MKVSNKQIANWIQMYLNTELADNVMRRSWVGQLIHRLQCDRKDESGKNVSVRWTNFIQDNLSSFDECADFESIHDKVAKYAVGFYGIGELTIYDTATCIAIPKGMHPDRVYKHAGTREGANALGVRGKTPGKEQFVSICKAFERLEPMQIEDFLCIFKACLKGDTKKCKETCERVLKNSAKFKRNNTCSCNCC